MKELYRKNKWIFVALFCLILFIYYLVWSIAKPYDYAPDEYTRMALCNYLFENGKLPTGWLSEIRNEWWGFSYAFYYTWLPSVLSALCMKIASFFTMNAKVILTAARFPNVVASVVTSLFVFKSADKLLTNERVKWFIFISVSMTPQFVFLSSYINNDALALMGSSIICYTWISILKDKLDIKTAALMGVGISVVALSYYNAYGWILLSMVLFVILIFVYQKGEAKDRKTLWICGLVVVGIVAALCGYFMIRNAIIYDGDLFGLKSLEESSEMYAVDELKPSLRDTYANRGESLWNMLFKTDWIEKTFKSSVGYFGYMMFECSIWLYIIYLCIDAVGFVTFIIDVCKVAINKDETRLKNTALRILMVLAAIIPLVLSIHYSYFTDYQPQGRYIYPAFPAVAVFLGLGYEALYKWAKDKLKIPVKVLNILVIIVSIGMVITSFYAFSRIYMRSSWGSMEDFIYQYPMFTR